MQVDVDESTPSTVSRTDPLVCETDPAYVRPLPYQRLIDYLDILMSGHPAGTGAGPEAPVASDASLLCGGSVDMKCIVDRIVNTWHLLSDSMKEATLGVSQRNFVFAEVPILSEKWGCSIGPFTNHTGASPAWMLAQESGFQTEPILYTWSSRTYDDATYWHRDSWRYITASDDDFSKPDPLKTDEQSVLLNVQQPELLDGSRGSCFYIAQQFESSGGLPLRNRFGSGTVDRGEMLALMNGWREAFPSVYSATETLILPKDEDHKLYYQVELFLSLCDRGKCNPGDYSVSPEDDMLITDSFDGETITDPENMLKSLCMHLLLCHKATGVICQRARVWLFTIARDYEEAADKAVDLITAIEITSIAGEHEATWEAIVAARKAIVESLDYVKIPVGKPSQQIDQYGKPRVFPFVDPLQSREYQWDLIMLTIARASLCQKHDPTGGYCGRTCLLRTEAYDENKLRDTQNFSSDFGHLQINREQQRMQFSRGTPRIVKAEWWELDSAANFDERDYHAFTSFLTDGDTHGGASIANSDERGNQAFVSWLMDGNTHGGVSTAMLALQHYDINEKRMEMAPAQQILEVLEDLPTMKSSISTFRYSLVRSITGAFNLHRMQKSDANESSQSIERQIKASLDSATDAVDFFVNLRLPDMPAWWFRGQDVIKKDIHRLASLRESILSKWSLLQKQWSKQWSNEGSKEMLAELQSLPEKVTIGSLKLSNDDRYDLQYVCRDAIACIRDAQRMRRLDEWLGDSKAEIVHIHYHICEHCHLPFVRECDYAAHMLYAKECMQSAKNTNALPVQAVRADDLEVANYADAWLVSIGTPVPQAPGDTPVPHPPIDVTVAFWDNVIKNTTLRSVRPMRGSFIHFPRAMMVYNAINVIRHTKPKPRMIFIGSFALAVRRYLHWTNPASPGVVPDHKVMFWLILKWIDSGHDIDLVINRSLPNGWKNDWTPIGLERFEERHFTKTTTPGTDSRRWRSEPRTLSCMIHSYSAETADVTLLKVQSDQAMFEDNSAMFEDNPAMFEDNHGAQPAICDVHIATTKHMFDKLCSVVTDFQNIKWPQVQHSLDFLKGAHHVGPLRTRIEEWYNICMASKKDVMTNDDMRWASRGSADTIQAHMRDPRIRPPYLGQRFEQSGDSAAAYKQLSWADEQLRYKAAEFIETMAEDTDMPRFLPNNPQLAFQYTVFLCHIESILKQGKLQSLINGELSKYRDARTVYRRFEAIMQFEAVKQGMLVDAAQLATTGSVLELQYLPPGYVTYAIQKGLRTRILIAGEELAPFDWTEHSHLDKIQDMLHESAEDGTPAMKEIRAELCSELLWNCNDQTFMKKYYMELFNGDDNAYMKKNWTPDQIDAAKAFGPEAVPVRAHNRSHPLNANSMGEEQCGYETPWGMQMDPNRKRSGYKEDIWIGRRRLVAFFMQFAKIWKVDPAVMNYYLHHSYNEHRGIPTKEAVLYNKVLAEHVGPSLLALSCGPLVTATDAPIAWPLECTKQTKLECTESARVDRIYLGKLFRRGARCRSCVSAENATAHGKHYDSDYGCYVPQSRFDEYTPFEFESPQVWDYSDSGVVKPTSGDLCGKPTSGDLCGTDEDPPTSGDLCGTDEDPSPRAFVLTLSCPDPNHANKKVRVQLKQEAQSLLDMLPTPESDNSPGLSCECCMGCGSYGHPSGGSPECPLYYEV